MKRLFYTSLVLLSLVCFYSLPVLAQWSIATLSLARGELTAVSVGEKALFAGGRTRGSFGNYAESSQVDIYNVTTGQWTIAQLSQKRFDIAGTSLGNLAFFAGGSISTIAYFTRIDIYNTLTDQWTTAELSKARFGIAAASAGSKVLFAGGATFNNNCSCYSNFNTIDVYDIATNQWSVTQLPNLQGRMLATSVGNKILFTKNEAGNGLIDIYDVTTGQWTTATIPQSLSASAAISVGNKALFAIGTPFSDQVSIYDVDTNQWSTTSLSPARRLISTARLGSKVFFAGGFSAPSYANSKVVDIYDASTDQWSATQFPQVSGSIAAVRVGNKILFGGDGSANVDIYTDANILPVNLISFSGAWTEGTGAQLSWQTSLETNNDHFEIQRSSDAKSFETIGRIQGRGTTNERTEYSFVDADMPGQISYYRLKQVDFDGSSHLSNIIAINRQEKSQQLASLSVWPMPTTSSLTLKLSAGRTISQITVYDLYGRRLSSQVGSQSTTNVSGLQAGIYILDVLTTNGQHLRTRFVKQ